MQLLVMSKEATGCKNSLFLKGRGNNFKHKQDSFLIFIQVSSFLCVSHWKNLTQEPQAKNSSECILKTLGPSTYGKSTGKVGLRYQLEYKHQCLAICLTIMVLLASTETIIHKVFNKTIHLLAFSHYHDHASLKN